MRAAHDAQVMPPTVRSMRACGASCATPEVMSASADDAVTGLVHGGSHRRVVEVGAGDVEGPARQVDGDAVDARDLGDLFGDRLDAVATGHPLDLVRLRRHRGLPCLRSPGHDTPAGYADQGTW